MGNKNSRHGKVDQYLKNEQLKNERLYRVLLLGPGDSGKSTILKQMKKIEDLHHEFGHNPEYIDQVPLIREAILIYIHILCKTNKLLENAVGQIDDNIIQDVKINNDNIQLRDYFAETKITRFDANENSFGDEDEKNIDDDDQNNLEALFRIFSKLVKSHIKPLWNDKGIQNTMKYRSSFPEQIPDTAVYFLDKIEDVAEDDYTPSFEDYLRLRTKTSGAQIINIEIDLDKLSDPENDNNKKEFGIFNFEFTDIGGQAAERNKWARVMNDSISVVLFVVAISEYDLPCYEDNTKRRMLDALDAFKKLMTHKLGPRGPLFVENKQIFVLFNKFDLLEEKLFNVPLNTIEEFSDFSYEEKDGGGELVDAVLEYFQERFLQVIDEIRQEDETKVNDNRHIKLNFNTEKQLSFETSEALKTQLIQTLFHKIMLQVVTGNLERMGMAGDSLV